MGFEGVILTKVFCIFLIISELRLKNSIDFYKRVKNNTLQFNVVNI